MTVKDVFGDIRRAVSLLTRLPVHADYSTGRTAQSAWAYPVVGLIVGGIGAAVGAGAMALGLPATVAGALCIASQVIVIGAMHEDGLADTADGMWGGWTPARRLEIMKDSHIGAYGVIALILGLGLRGALATALLIVSPVALILGAVFSRVGMVAVMAALPHARRDGLSRTTGRPGGQEVMVALSLSAFLSAALCGISVAVVLACATALGAGTVALLARAKIKGQTGDILGAAQQVAEICALAALCIVLT